jgi:molecular chaperone HtpG
MTTAPQEFEFQTEIKQLLDIVIHSLYTEKEIFVRELVSNASDALEKLRHLQLTEKDVYEADQPLEIRVTSDEQAKTITIEDTGLGMSRAELIENLGTVAHSGSKAFLKALGEAGAKGTNLIGQFGVGFYSAFMAAKQVRVTSRSYRPAEPGHLWVSDGAGRYTIEERPDAHRGSQIVLELKDECAEFASEWKLKDILARYSSFVGFPVKLNGTRLNTVQAVWLRSKSEVKDEEYLEFYKYQAHAYDEPRLRLHFSADAPLQMNALLFVPKESPERFGLMRAQQSVSLYCRKVMVEPHPKDLFPEWLRFLKGVVDSEELPLHISRETMQDKALLEKLSKVLTKRFLKFLEDEAKARPEAYDELFSEFGLFLKEGAATDYLNRDALLKLLRYESSATEAGKHTSLTEYVSRMREGQKEIFYIVGPSRAAIEAGPYLEGFKARSLEVLYCFEPVDDYVMSNAREFEGKKLAAADDAETKLEASAVPAGEGLSEDETKELCAWLKATLGERVAEVKGSDRLVDSPVVALNADRQMGPRMRRMMRAMKQEGADAPAKVNLELNPRHAVIRKLFTSRSAQPERAKLIAEQLLDNALISAGLLEDASAMVKRLNTLLAEL